MTGTVERRICVRRVLSVAKSGATIFSGVTDDDRHVRVVASAKAVGRVPLAGEAWFVGGEFRVHPAYGDQLHASHCRYELPRGRLIVRYLAEHPDFAGIGAAKAARLWETFGERLAPTLVAADVDALEAVLTRPMAVRLVETWAQKRVEAETVEFLDAHGLDWSLATKLRRAWGDSALTMLKRNPYFLLAFVGWSKVDNAALKLGIALDDDRRLVGAVEAVLYERLQQAHTLAAHVTLADRVARLVGRALVERAIDLAVAEGAVCGDREKGFQAFGAAALEQGIAARIRAMLVGEAPEQQPLFSIAVAGNWSTPVIASVEAEQGFSLNDEQRVAVVLPFEHAFSVLTGGAGVGKTTVLKVVLRLAERQNLSVLQMALAGRAAQRMAEATGHPAMTIAKFLAATRSGQLEVPSSCLVVVDEASMLDLPTLYRILKHLPDGARLMLVGDPAQLPPIGFGLVFHRLVGNANVPQARLLTVHRQAAASGIPAVATAVREHRVPALVPYVGRHSGVSFIECRVDECMEQLRRLQTAWVGDDWQVLSAVKGGRGGIRFINDSFHHDKCGDGAYAYAVGEPVIHLVNDYERGLMNGALGHIVAVGEDGGLELSFDGETHAFTAVDLVDRIDLAYAISVHKSQGSQFRRVAIVIGRSRLLDHALIYTALTRGVDQVVFIGDRQAFEQAVLTPPLAQRRCVAFTV
jgi:exodeoxyribonuclease V alpha subunit